MTSTILPGPTYTGRPINVDRVTSRLIEELIRGGVTLAGTATPYTGDGIAVAVPEYGELIPLGLPDARRHIREWVELRAHAVSQSARFYFGAWLSGEYLYLDVVEIFSSADEDLAVAAGRRRNQISVWHNGRQQEIPTGGTGVLV